MYIYIYMCVCIYIYIYVCVYPPPRRHEGVACLRGTSAPSCSDRVYIYVIYTHTHTYTHTHIYIYIRRRVAASPRKDHSAARNISTIIFRYNMYIYIYYSAAASGAASPWRGCSLAKDIWICM